MMTVGFISKLDQCSLKLGSPSHTTGMITLKEVVICLIVFSKGGAINYQDVLVVVVTTTTTTRRRRRTMMARTTTTTRNNNKGFLILLMMAL
jgi:hypothetical protein